MRPAIIRINEQCVNQKLFSAQREYISALLFCLMENNDEFDRKNRYKRKFNKLCHFTFIV